MRMSAYRSWMMTFMRAMAKVVGLISCPNRRKGAMPGVDEQPAGAAGQVIDGHARLWIEQVRHQDGDLARGVEFPGALPLPLSELPQQVLIGAPQDVRLNILQAQAVPGKHLTSSPS